MDQEAVNHPKHYNMYEGFEVIDVCEQLNGPDGKSGFNLGNAFKYIARAGLKDPSKFVEDLEKAKFYIQREIDRVKPAEEDPIYPPILLKEPIWDKERGFICPVCGDGMAHQPEDNRRWMSCNGCAYTYESLHPVKMSAMCDVCRVYRVHVAHDRIEGLYLCVVCNARKASEPH